MLFSRLGRLTLADYPIIEFVYRVTYRVAGSDDEFKQYRTVTRGAAIYPRVGTARSVATQEQKSRGKRYEFRVEESELNWSPV